MAPVGALGEDAAAFSVEEQSAGSWGAFFAVLTVVMGLLYLLWLSPERGLGDDYAAFFKALTPSSEVGAAAPFPPPNPAPALALAVPPPYPAPPQPPRSAVLSQSPQ